VDPAARPSELTTVIVIPDAHASPGQDFRRFRWLGRYISEVRAITDGRLVVVNIGDFADVLSLSYFDKGKRKAEGRRYSDDVDACRDALCQLHMAAPKKGVEWVTLLGNHEHRIDRATQEAPELYGAISTTDLGFEAHGHTVVPFLHLYEIEGVSFAHYMQSKMGRAISGVNHARSLVLNGHTSLVVGHSHCLDAYWDAGYAGKPIRCLSVGHYYETPPAEYLVPAARARHWAGIVTLHNVANGDFDLETLRMDTLQQRYGD